jgi:DNA-binding transcriptional regulator YiaG
MLIKPKPKIETPGQPTLHGEEPRALREAYGLTPQALAERPGETTAAVVWANTPPIFRR